MNDALDVANFRCSGAALFAGHVKRKKNVTNEHLSLSLDCMAVFALAGASLLTTAQCLLLGERLRDADASRLGY
jgi:hypothetical protein